MTTHRSDYPHTPLTDRMEGVAGDQTYTSLSDFDATLAATATSEQVSFDARGAGPGTRDAGYAERRMTNVA